MTLLSTPRSRLAVLAAVAAAVAVIIVAALMSSLGGSPQTVEPVGRAAPVASGTPAASPSAVADSPSPSPSPTPSASPTPAPTRKTASGKVLPPPPKQVVIANPPPPASGGRPPGPSTPPPGASCPKLNGPVAPRSDVAAAMDAAAGRSYRPTLSLDDHNPPPIAVRPLLVQGVGWMESGWQSTIESCDGGLGTMQVMADTATWMNQKYGTDYDRASLTGNINIATGYLAWLTRYFGDRYFNGDYSLAGSPDKLVLLDLVISAYQAGFGVVDNAMAAGRDLPNRWYVDTVEGFMTRKPWTAPA
ncbi:hypothetical protein Pme01_59610 [Planosporangium mesophilum]|uniref:Transglycosylase SLT domain-containing protein n=1 Tax=Planosporangium mesophilum TaxID=689768 RepID=A0A8J3THI2_9ACTN|nr:hypothetical protein Pme01_59610 [Planosporangium mesophilum]